MFKKNKLLDFQGGLLPLDEIISSEPSNQKQKGPKNFYKNESIHDIYIQTMEKPFENSINNYHTTKNVIGNIQSQNISQTKTFTQTKRTNVYKPIQNHNNEIKRNIIQKGIIIANALTNYNTNPTTNNQKKIQIQQSIFNKSPNNSLLITSNNKQNQNDNRIRNIPISLKKINLEKKRALSKKSQSTNRNYTEPFLYKSPYKKRKPSIEYKKNESNSIIHSHLSPKKNNLIPKPIQKYNYKKKFSSNNSYNSYNNSNIANKKIDKNLVTQNKTIKKIFELKENEKKEKEIFRKKNDYYLNRGIFLEERINLEAYCIKIQSYFRGYYIRKKIFLLINNCIKIGNGINLIQKVFSFKKYNIYNLIKKYNYINNNKKQKLINNLRNKSINNNNNQISFQNNNILIKLKKIESHFKNASIDYINNIIINIPKREDKIKKNSYNEKKYILKYLFLKKENKIKKILKINFEKFKNNTNIKLNYIEQKINNSNSHKKLVNNDSIEDLRIKKLKDLVRKKSYKNKEVMHRVFLKYYYNSLYIHLNWYIYVVNQLTYTQNLMNSNNNNNYNNYYTTNNNTANQNLDLFRQSIKPIQNSNNNEHNSEVNNALRESIISINQINSNQNTEDALRESIMSINKINEALSNEKKENQKLQKKKHLKELVLNKLKERKNEFHKMFTKFYYQGLLVAKEKKEKNSILISGKSDENEINIDENTKSGRLRAKTSVNPRNKARNLRKLMIKREKEKSETLRKYFYKFYTNGMISTLRKNAKANYYSSKNVIVNSEENDNNNIIEQNNQNEVKELTLLDKKRIEKVELDEKKIRKIRIIFYKKERQIIIIKKKTIEKWNLRAKILSLDEFKKKDLAKSVRFKKKKLTRSRRAKTDYNNVEREQKEE